MKGRTFLEIINDIDNDLIQNAEKAKGRRDKHITMLIASSAIMAVASVILFLGLLLSKNRINNSDKNAELQGTMTSVVESQTSSQFAESETEPKFEAETTSAQIQSTSGVSEETTSPSAGTMPTQVISESSIARETGSDYIDESEDMTYEYETPDPFTEDNDYTRQAEVEPSSEYNPGTIEATETAGYWVTSIEQSYDANNYEADDSWELFWSDGQFNYYMNTGVAAQTFVFYENGEMEDLITALSEGHIDIYDLDVFGISYMSE